MKGITTAEQLQIIASQIMDKDYYYDYDCIGLRVQEDDIDSKGDIMRHKSYVWIDGDITDDQLEGVCAVDVEDADKLSKYSGYPGNYVYVLGSVRARGGNDPGEIIMINPVVLDLIITQ